MRSQPFKFVLVGILNTCISFIAYIFFISFVSDNYLFALMFSHLFGIINSYFWNRRWTFNSVNTNHRSILKFVLVYFITFLVNLLLLHLLIDNGGINKLLSQALALLVTTAISFVGHKYWSFKKINGVENSETR
ncbi:GtrA family protein [Paenibacillus sp. Marseille-P2973]|nr:GtrA family protein [Paenibacillus sp. Marseille-P2973]